MSSGDHDADLLDSLGELIGLDSSVIVEIEIFESLHQDCLLVGVAGRLLGQFLLKSLLKAVHE